MRRFSICGVLALGAISAVFALDHPAPPDRPADTQPTTRPGDQPTSQPSSQPTSHPAHVVAVSDRVKLWIEQDGRPVAVAHGAVALQRKPFALVVEMPKEHAFNIHGSTTDAFTRMLKQRQAAGGFRYCSAMTMAYDADNSDREFLLNPDPQAFTGLFHSAKGPDTFDREVVRNGRVVGWHTVGAFYLLKPERRAVAIDRWPGERVWLCLIDPDGVPSDSEGMDRIPRGVAYLELVFPALPDRDGDR